MTTDVDHLIDISSHNDVPDWGAVRRNGIVGASVKVSQATNYLNPQREGQVAGARSADVAPGGYHFGDPRVTAVDQAKFFVANAEPLGLFDNGALAPMYDAENWEGGGLVWPSPRELNAHIKEHIRVVRGETGVLEHLVYGSLNWWETGWLDPDVWADEHVKLWVAVYNGDPGNLQGWDHPQNALHQHTSQGLVDGVAGQVDKNVTVRGRRLADLLIGGDDMATVPQEQWDQTWEWVQQQRAGKEHRNNAGVDYIATLDMRNRVAAVADQVPAIFGLLSEIHQDPTIDADKMREIVETAQRDANAKQLEAIGLLVESKLGLDNTEQARDIVAEIGKLFSKEAA